MRLLDPKICKHFSKIFSPYLTAADTGWSGKFALLSGIVTEFGGVLCHGAIVAREYGIPYIASVAGATKKIKNGSLIKINGETGEVFLLSEGKNINSKTK